VTATTSDPVGLVAPQPRAVEGTRRWLWAAAGPLAFGAVLGVGGTFGEATSTALVVPAVLAATALLTLPSLFVGLAWCKVGPDLRGFLHACASSMESLGIVLAGLAPALLFLIATGSNFRTMPLLFGSVFLAIAAVVSTMGLFKRLIPASQVQKALGVYVTWTLVALGVGLHLFTKYVALEVMA